MRNGALYFLQFTVLLLICKVIIRKQVKRIGWMSRRCCGSITKRNGVTVLLLICKHAGNTDGADGAYYLILISYFLLLISYFLSLVTTHVKRTGQMADIT